MKKTILLSLGGSLVAPNGVDGKFLANFRDFIRRNLKNFRFIIVVGGGKTSRNYSQVAQSLGIVDDENLDRIGIYASRLNAQLVRTIFHKEAEAEIVRNLDVPVKFQKSVLVAAGTKPGWSTDFVATKLAQKFKVKRVINLTNTSHVYTQDPKLFKAARPIHHLGWIRFRKLVGSRWLPGLSMPFDPIASRLAQKAKLEVVIVNGRDFDNLQNILKGDDFEGTTISGK
jgi:uridylate kinase